MVYDPYGPGDHGASPFDDFLARFYGSPRRPQRIDIGKLMTEQARELVREAAAQAAQWGDLDLDTDHLLWAATRQEPVRRLLAAAGADPDAIAHDIESRAQRGRAAGGHAESHAVRQAGAAGRAADLAGVRIVVYRAGARAVRARGQPRVGRRAGAARAADHPETLQQAAAGGGGRQGTPPPSDTPTVDEFGTDLTAMARAIIVHGWVLPVVFIFVGPFIGLGAGLVVIIILSRVVRHQAPRRVDKWFRRLQLVSAATFSLGHGTNNAQKGMGIITAALVSSGTLTTYRVPYWVILCCHLAIAGGTMAGGWRVVKTMGQKITKLNPFGGFAAETSAAITLDRDGRRGHPSECHARHHRSHRRGRRRASPYCGAVGRYPANFLGLGAHHSGRRSDGRGVLLSFDSLDQVIWRVTPNILLRRFPQRWKTSAGRMLVVVDDEDRENEGDLTIAAEKVTPEAINFMATYGRGLICLTLTGERCDTLRLPLMSPHNTSNFGTAFCESIDAREGVTTGISAADRTGTILTAIQPGTRPNDLARPGHVFPLRERGAAGC